MKKEDIKKSFNKSMKQMDKTLKIKHSYSNYAIIGILLLSVVLTAGIFFNMGSSEGYREKTAEVHKAESIEVQADLMSMELNEVWEIFLKFIMVKVMFWLPWIVIALLLGWIIHGVF